MATGDLNRVIQQAYQGQPPPMRQNRQGKIYYATQVATNPPTIVLFTNGPDLFDAVYQRYLIKFLRDRSVFRDVSIKLQLRSKNRTGADDVESVEQTEKRPTARKIDLSGLKFHSQLTEEEIERANKRKDRGLWDI